MVRMVFCCMVLAGGVLGLREMEVEAEDKVRSHPPGW